MGGIPGEVVSSKAAISFVSIAGIVACFFRLKPSIPIAPGMN